MSAILPNGTRRAADASRYAVATQLNVIASNESSPPRVGRATFTEDVIKGNTNDASVMTKSTTPLLAPLPPESLISG